MFTFVTNVIRSLISSNKNQDSRKNIEHTYGREKDEKLHERRKIKIYYM